MVLMAFLWGSKGACPLASPCRGSRVAWPQRVGWLCFSTDSIVDSLTYSVHLCPLLVLCYIMILDEI